jgi:hypothetical protein
MITFFFMVALACRSRIVHGRVLVVTDVVEAGDGTVGIVGTTAVCPMVPATSGTLGVGIAAAELTPRLPISREPRGIAARMIVVVDAVDVGADEATPVEPEPHIPDIPAVAGIPEVADNPEVADTPEVIPDVAVVFDVAAATVDAVAAGVAPLSVWPPPSKLAGDPNMPAGGVPNVEHVVFVAPVG